MSVRSAQYAGSFYSSDSAELKENIEEFFSQVDSEDIEEAVGREPEIEALISPHAGYQYSGPVAVYGYKAIQEWEFSTVYILGLSHRYPLRGIALSDFEIWRTPFGDVEVDLDKVKALNQSEVFKIINEPHEIEHSIEVQIPMLQYVLNDFKLVPMLTGMLSEEEIIITAEGIADQLNDDTLFIVSTDLSHYRPYREAMDRDKITIDSLLELEAGDLIGDDACGYVGLKIITEIAKIKDWNPYLLEYMNSGETAGNIDQVVGYASIAYI